MMESGPIPANTSHTNWLSLIYFDINLFLSNCNHVQKKVCSISKYKIMPFSL